MYYFVLIGGFGMFRSRYGGLDFIFKFAIQRVPFVVFLVKYEWIVEFVCTYYISGLFGLREGHPPSEFRFHRLF